VTDGIWQVEVDGARRLAVGPTDGGPQRLLAPEVRLAAALGAGGSGLDELLRAPGGAVPAGARTLAPVDRQPVWAAGVTFERSRDGRLEESGGADYYTKVYAADRPELFFKSLPGDVRGPDAAVTIRPESTWNVAEPELAVVVDARGRIAGYLLGNDVCSRDIEGENPLYLPQAKVYDGSCALGPCLVPRSRVPEVSTLEISLTVAHDGEVRYTDRVPLSRMRRTVEELVEWLVRALRFPDGVVLLTGTSIVPPSDFSLAAGDLVTVAAPGLGTLVNPVVVLR